MSNSSTGGQGILEQIWDLRDQRVDEWPLMSSPLPTVALCGLYFYTVKFMGPRFMKERKPYDLKNTIIVYNLVQVAFSAWLLFKIFFAGWGTTYSFWCEPVRTDPPAMLMVNMAWWYFISKFTEFFDTFFFVLRKKNNNVSTLHVLHHGLMPLFTWEACRFVPGGHESLGALLNTFIHVVMYTYYALAALGPHMQPYLWWKRHLTKMQMIQFSIVVGHSCLLLFKNDCGYPIAQSGITTGFMIMFLALFGQFYSKSYKEKGNAKSFEEKLK